LAAQRACARRSVGSGLVSEIDDAPTGRGRARNHGRESGRHPPASATGAASDTPAIVVRKRIFHVARRRSTDYIAEVAGDHEQPPGCHHGVRTLGKQKDLEGRGLLAAPLFTETGYGEDLVRAAEVEHLDVGEDEDANALALHLTPLVFTR